MMMERWRRRGEGPMEDYGRTDNDCDDMIMVAVIVMTINGLKKKLI